MRDNLFEYHRYLDEAGDTTFYGKGRIPILGKNGVSNTFILGMVSFKSSLKDIRSQIIELQKNVENNKYYNKVPSVEKRINNGGFYFHAKDDLPELRKEFYDFILNLDCSFEAVVGRKNISLFEKKHNGKDTEFYADMLSHLIKNKFSKRNKLVFNIAERSNSTAINNLEKGLEKAKKRYLTKYPDHEIISKISFCVHKYCNEPLLSVTDYFCWAVQRVFEKGETRFYDYMTNKISLVVDLYDSDSYENSKNYYKASHPLTEKNKVSPQSS
jgi:hypothetical protein